MIYLKVDFMRLFKMVGVEVNFYLLSTMYFCSTKHPFIFIEYVMQTKRVRRNTRYIHKELDLITDRVTAMNYNL